MVVNATLIAALSSRENEKGVRDPEMHQKKKGSFANTYKMDCAICYQRCSGKEDG
jgi:hypothetical protein